MARSGGRARHAQAQAGRAGAGHRYAEVLAPEPDCPARGRNDSGVDTERGHPPKGVGSQARREQIGYPIERGVRAGRACGWIERVRASVREGRPRLLLDAPAIPRRQPFAGESCRLRERVRCGRASSTCVHIPGGPCVLRSPSLSRSCPMLVGAHRPSRAAIRASLAARLAMRQILPIDMPPSRLSSQDVFPADRWTIGDIDRAVCGEVACGYLRSRPAHDRTAGVQ